MLRLDPGDFSEDFPKRHFQLEHELAGHPLFRLDTILPNLAAHPPMLVECRSGDLAMGDGLTHEHSYGLGQAEVEERLRSKNSWMQIRHAQLIPQYRDMLMGCIEQIRAASQELKLGIHEPVAYILISSPGAVTPFHFDNEHNFLLQISGTKTVYTWGLDNAQAVSPADKERYYYHGFHDVKFDPALQASAKKFELRPGLGVHLPVHSPHSVVTGPEMAVSLAITFLSEKLQQEANVHWLNARLKTMGISARPYRDSPVVDNGKFYMAKLWRRLINHRLRPFR